MSVFKLTHLGVHLELFADGRARLIPPPEFIVAATCKMLSGELNHAGLCDLFDHWRAEFFTRLSDSL